MRPWSEVNLKVSNLKGVGNAVYDEATKIAAKAEVRLTAHRKPDDDTSSSIDVARGTKGVDSFIVLEDDGGGAIGIEFGYRAENGRIVHGLHIITGAAGLA
jgi:hypothetical protein